MLKRAWLSFFIVVSLLIFCNLGPVFAQENQPQPAYLKAQVLEILEEGTKEVGEGISHAYQKLRLKFLEGEEKNNLIELEYGGSFNLQEAQKAKKNDTLILLKQEGEKDKIQYFVTDKYRLGNIGFIFFLFFLAVILVSGLQGINSMFGMLVSLFIVLKFIVPQILAGRNPLFISLIGSLFILVTSIYLAHGLNKKTHLAVLATFICLLLTGILSVIFSQMALLTGLGSEEAYALTLGQTATINFKGLLLGSIIIGTLGVLDDITTTQASALFELHEVNPQISFDELFKRGFNIGKEHVAATVNTLILAYVGASLALFLIFYVSGQNQPFWMILNSEIIAEEIIRSLAGSLGLVLAVPITTFLAAYYLKKK
jgi:uncharacterized membrane protein